MHPKVALADCTPAGNMTYDDIDGIAVKTCGTVRQHYEAWALRNGSAVFFGQANSPIKGTHEGRNNAVLFGRLLQILKNDDFFAIRLRQSKTAYIDGPCLSVEVSRCGVTTALSGLGAGMLPFAIDLHDEQSDHFFKLFRNLQDSLFAWPWPESSSTPEPSP
jgi:hypothetical protein